VRVGSVLLKRKKKRKEKEKKRKKLTEHWAKFWLVLSSPMEYLL